MPDYSIKVDVPVDRKGRYGPGQVPAAFTYPKWKPKQPKGSKLMVKGKLSWHIPNKKGMGRAKGNTHERETARTLSLWFYGKSKWLKRTPLSGGWASGKAGDIILDHEIGRRKDIRDPAFYVECRSYAGVLQNDILRWASEGTPKIYTEWIKEVEAKCSGRLPMLVLKGKGTGPWLFLLRRWFPDDYTYMRNVRVASPVILYPENYGIVYLIPLDEKHLKYICGDGVSFMDEWRENGGPSCVRRLSRLIQSGKVEEAKGGRS